MNELFTRDIVFSAYKKLKHYYYYDNTSLLIRQKISEFEALILKGKNLDNIKTELFNLVIPILNLDKIEAQEYFKGVDKNGNYHIDYHVIPKKFKKKILVILLILNMMMTSILTG